MKLLQLLMVLFLLSGCSPENEVQRSFENRVGTVFTPGMKNVLKAPSVDVIAITDIESIDAIWGATGRDDQGKIYFATSSHGGDYGSSYLYQYDPLTKLTIAQSDTVTQLKANSVYRHGMHQNKLHSKFYQADDGYIYFSSFDEGGESEGVNPKWGGNLWRKLPKETNWEHVLSTPEALVAVNTNGKYIYALGYWDHVLYQYDIDTEKIIKVTVGSVGKHTSRNFIVDERGYAYVPRVSQNDTGKIESFLIEYDTNLNEIAQHKLPSYQSHNMNKNNGIVAYTSVKNGDIYFLSAEGGLYKVNPFASINNKVNYLGFMHSEGKAYITSLFSIDGKGMLVGIGRKASTQKASPFEWIVYQKELHSSYSIELPLNDMKKPLLYGSLTRDNLGDFYIGGWHYLRGSYKPLLLRLSKTTHHQVQ